MRSSRLPRRSYHTMSFFALSGLALGRFLASALVGCRVIRCFRVFRGSLLTLSALSFFTFRRLRILCRRLVRVRCRFLAFFCGRLIFCRRIVSVCGGIVCLGRVAFRGRLVICRSLSVVTRRSLGILRRVITLCCLTLEGESRKHRQKRRLRNNTK